MSRSKVPDQLFLDACAAAKAFRWDPVHYVDQILRVRLWSGQAKILRAVQKHRHVCVKSCHGIGKTFGAGCAANWFHNSHPWSTTITTAPSNRQVVKLLWKEIPILFNRAKQTFKALGLPLRGRYTQSPMHQIITKPGWEILGFAPNKYDPNSFQGFHSDHVLVIVDEAAGVHENIYKGISGVLTGPHPRQLDIGNPEDPTSMFAQNFRRSKTHKITISAYDTPNFTTFGITHEDMVEEKWRDKVNGAPMPWPKLITPYDVEDTLDKYGESSPWYVARVLAQFPENTEHTIIPWAWIERAIEAGKEVDPRDVDGEERQFGVDIGAGGDPSVIVERNDESAYVLDTFTSEDTMETAGWIARWAKKRDPNYIKVDHCGIGHGVTCRLQELHFPAVAMISSARSCDPDKFLNARAEWVWTLREKFESGLITMSPRDHEAANQLWKYQTVVNSTGKIQIEPKPKMKARIGRSPDEGDAFMYAFGEPRGEVETPGDMFTYV